MKFFNGMLVLALTLFSAATFAQAININTASAKELDKGVVGIGPSKSASIVKYREANGPFKSVDDLKNVPGIKEKELQKILANHQNQLTVGDATASAPTTAAPTTPATPTTPAMPTTPAAAPTTPATPAMPAVPKTPAMPAVPKTPAMPAVPAAPTVPAGTPKM